MYDDLNPVGPAIALVFFLAAHIDARRVVDVGCGTGRLAVDFAQRGYDVTAVDPSSTMIAYARARHSGELVRWVEGDASVLGKAEYDLAVMSGYVVESITDDRTLITTLEHIRGALRPSGRLVFDSRNPASRCWTDWNPETSRQELPDGAAAWHRSTAVEGDLISYETHYQLPTGTSLVSLNKRRFRSSAWLTRAMADAGFNVDPFDNMAPDYIMVATASPPRRVIDLHVHAQPAEAWWASVIYDSAEAVTVPLSGLDQLTILARLHELRVPIELIYREMAASGVNWDIEADVRQRSDADMNDWRQRDRERREQLKREFRTRRSVD